MLIFFVAEMKMQGIFFSLNQMFFISSSVKFFSVLGCSENSSHGSCC